MKVKPDSGKEITPRVIAWLHYCWELGERGENLQPDPFYERNAELTPGVVKDVIGAIESLFVSELKKFPGYHQRAQGVSESEQLVPPGFDTLPSQEQLAVVQGVDRIFQEYRASDEPAC